MFYVLYILHFIFILHFKFNELRYKGIPNDSYKCMVIIIPQLKKMFHMKAF